MALSGLRRPCFLQLVKFGSKIVPQLEHSSKYGISTVTPSITTTTTTTSTSSYSKKTKVPTVTRINVKGYDEFKNTVAKITDKQLNIYFSGDKNKNGVSWCPDCVRAEPHVAIGVQKFAKKDSVFLYVEVGDRRYWKNLNNHFRVDKQIRVSVIPTLLRWKGIQRLEGSQCEKADLVEMFFTEN